MEAPDYKAFDFWFSVGQWVFNAAIALYLWISRKHTATLGKVEELACRMNDSEKTLIRVCTELDNLPGQQDFRELRKEITELTGELSEARGKLTVIDRTFSLINEFLINEGSRGNNNG